jgi:hypothetical protein
VGGDPWAAPDHRVRAEVELRISLSRKLKASDEERGILAANANINKEVEMPVLHGSCLCGGVKFEIAGPLTPPSNCHCWMCRKQQGAAFRSRARVRAAGFKWAQGEDLVKFYESTPGTFRGFCGVCGSPIINKFDARAKATAFRPAAVSEYGIALATLDDDPGVRPGFHTFVGSKAPWFEITDDLPQYLQLPAPY